MRCSIDWCKYTTVLYVRNFLCTILVCACHSFSSAHLLHQHHFPQNDNQNIINSMFDLHVNSSQGGVVWLDHVSLIPSDAVVCWLR